MPSQGLQVRQVMGRGMVAWTVVLVLTFFLPVRVVTVSVTWTLTELVPAVRFLLGVPDSTPVFLESFSPLGRETFFHFRVELSKRLGRPQSFVSKVERAERRLDLVELRQFCREVGVDVTRVVRQWERALG